VINVARGGSLYEDITDQHPGALKHDCYPDWPRDHLAHEVDIEPDSQLAQVLGRSHERVNSLHHQAIRQVSPELRTTAHAPDGIIEAVELPGHPFGLAVQWHPECLQAYAPMRLLFQAFVNAASQYRNNHS
jgi:putative glutamine amidotransferase